jgi:hypothetical protein
LADEHRRRGLSDAEARLAARREFGGVDQTREAFRDTRRLPGIDALVQDTRFAWRALRRDSGSTVAAIALLSVGVSSTVVLADVLDRLLLRPPTHVDDPARVRRVYEDWAEGDRPSRLVSNYITLERLAAGASAELERSRRSSLKGSAPAADRMRRASKPWHSARRISMCSASRLGSACCPALDVRATRMRSSSATRCGCSASEVSPTSSASRSVLAGARTPSSRSRREALPA